MQTLDKKIIVFYLFIFIKRSIIHTHKRVKRLDFLFKYDTQTISLQLPEAYMRYTCMKKI